MDALSDVLRIVRLTGAVFMDAEFTEPWCIGEPAGVEVCVDHLPKSQHVVIYHLVTEGRCEVSVPGRPAVTATAGDLIVIPGGQAHTLGSDLSRRPVPGGPLVVKRRPDEVPVVRHGGGGAVARLVCGYLACHSSLFDTVLAALPSVMVVDMREGPGAQWLTSSIRFSIAESAAQGPGASTVLAKLSELMFVEAIRRHIESLPAEQAGWLAGLRDPSVGKTLALIHSRPAHGWTVEDLAREVGVSRSALAERFTALVGRSPMHYLARWRLQLAGDLLRSGRQTVAAIAGDVGYDSEAAFSRAFKREMGVSPAAWRARA
ncbi:MAG TPA: AraC family transcriptional regulator [Candidatus Eisenbacteria bacterium]|nr:AraC family transcriptional regulator [Candidatus Eisenbacteria bacterium]